jgi:hypothetical protein
MIQQTKTSPKISPLNELARIAPRHTPTDDARSREICPGGVGFETRSASGGRGAVLVANSALPVLHGVSVLMVGNRLGLQISKPDDKQLNANGGIMFGLFVLCVPN